MSTQSGRYVTFNESSPNIPKSSVSSCSIPFVFPPQKWDDYEGSSIVCMDGGTVWNTNLVTAIERCREQVDDDSEISIDIITVRYPREFNWKDSRNAAVNFYEHFQIKYQSHWVDDIFEFMKAYPEVNFRYLVNPSKKLPGQVLNWNNETITWPCQE